MNRYKVWDATVLAVSVIVGLALIALGSLLAYDGLTDRTLEDGDYILGTGAMLALAGGALIYWVTDR